MYLLINDEYYYCYLLGGSSHGNQYIRNIETFTQQQQTMSHVANCGTPVGF